MIQELASADILKWQRNCPLLPLVEHCRKRKKCCKSYKKGDRCKKCPGRK